MTALVDPDTSRWRSWAAMVEDFGKDHGTTVSVIIKAKFQGGRQSAFEFLRSTLPDTLRPACQ